MDPREISAAGADVASLRARTSASLELAAILGTEAKRIATRFREPTSPPPQPADPPTCPRPDARTTRPPLRRDLFARRFPGIVARIAARVDSESLGILPDPAEPAHGPGSISRLFRLRVTQARRAGATLALFRALVRASLSVILDRFRLRLAIPPGFDERAYVESDPNIAGLVAAGRVSSGYEHWVRHGNHEGRRPPVRSLAPKWYPRVSPPPGVPASFDDDAYLFYHPQIASAVANGWFRSGYSHWRRYGRAEGRGGGAWNPLPGRAKFEQMLRSRPYGVNLYAFLSAASSMGSVARSCAAALAASGVPCHSIDIPDWKYGDEGRKLPSFAPYRVNLIQQNADMLPRFARCYGAGLLNGCYNIACWLWELPSFRGDWRGFFDYADEIWTPSEFCRQSLGQATRLPVVRVPLVVDGLEKKIVYPREHFGFPAGVFVFGYIFDIASYLDRKNPLCLIEAFRREFGDSPEVLLCLKYTSASFDKRNLRLLQDAVAGAPNIRAFGGAMDENEIVSFENALDCVVSPHRSEGFGLTLAEAMYLGKPAIATRYSGNLDFMHPRNSYLIDCTLTPIERDTGPYRAGSLWADPSVLHLRRLLREVLEDRAGRERKARQAAADIRAQYSAAAVGRVMSLRLEELGLSQPVPPRGILHSDRAERPPSFFHPDTPAAVAAEVRSWKSKPLVSVVTPVFNTPPGFLRACIESVRTQHYPFWELCLCDDGSTNPETLDFLEGYRGLDPRIRFVRLHRTHGIAIASNRAAELSTGGWLAMLDHDDTLAPDALLEIARAIVKNPEIDCLYTDEDKIDSTGAFVEHYCKPDWSPDHLLSVNYVLHMLVVRKDLFYTIGQFRAEFNGAQDYDLALRLSTRSRRVHHVPRVLYHWRKTAGSAAAQVDAKPAALDAGKRALENHLRRSDIDAVVEPGLLPGLFRVRRSLKHSPLASLCIVASGRTVKVAGRGPIDLLANLASGIAATTDYPNYEIVVVDDGNLTPATKRAIGSIPHRRVSCPPRQPFNFPYKANFAWRQAHGKHIVLLNDDLEIVSREWLGAMLEPLQDEAVGVVGAKLFFPDARIQHAGIVLGVHQTAAHLYYGFPAATIGYNQITHLIRNYSAVTGACLATRIDVLERAGGFDERFAADFNDVDFCLKAIQKGYRVVFTPHAQLIHFEGSSLTRRTQNPAERDLFAARWAPWMACDPYYNPNLSLQSVDFAMDPSIQFATP